MLYERPMLRLIRKYKKTGRRFPFNVWLLLLLMIALESERGESVGGFPVLVSFDRTALSTFERQDWRSEELRMAVYGESML
jgi:hypothetical protein